MLIKYRSMRVKERMDGDGEFGEFVYYRKRRRLRGSAAVPVMHTPVPMVPPRLCPSFILSTTP